MKTAQEKAAQELDIAVRRVERLTAIVADHQQKLTDTTAALMRARARADFLSKNPDLPEDVL